MTSYSAMEVNVQPNPAQKRYDKISGDHFACCGVVVVCVLASVTALFLSCPSYFLVDSNVRQYFVSEISF